MSFTSSEFVLFMALCLAVLQVIQRPSAQMWLLIVFSYLFCLSFGFAGVLVITLTALVDFNVGRQIENSTSSVNRKRWLWAGLAVNLGLLCFFKYDNFVAANLNALLGPLGVRIPVLVQDLLLPVGLSYFTLAGISYILDIYYERGTSSKSIAEYLCYLLYFPKLVAGPIVRASELLPQFRREVQPTAQDFETGCAYLLVGCVKKLVIADQLAGHVGMIFAAPEQYNAFTLLQGVLGYTVQIYADFSGYSDMAIGCARLMGIKFPQNFLMPYSSLNIAEFWRRWHVTLSTWLRDYVFFPLEMGSRGIRNANIRVSRNLLVTMLVCGLWHGASWNFVLWGGLHGLALAIHQVYGAVFRRGMRPPKHSMFHPAALVSRGLTLSVVMAGWILFGTATPKVAFQYFGRLLTWNTSGIALGSAYILPLTALMIVAHLIVNKDRNLVEELPLYPVQKRVVTYASLLVALSTLVTSNAVPFVYVHF